MSKPIYWAIAAGAALAVVWVVASRHEPVRADIVSEDSPAVAPASASLGAQATGKPASASASAPAPGLTPAANIAVAPAASAAPGTAMPIDVSPGFEFLSKPAAEMKDTDVNWGVWRRHQKLENEPRDEEWAPRMEAALRNGFHATLTAKGLDTQRIELPVVECRSTGCEIQAVGYSQDSMQGGFDYQQVLGGLMMGPLGSEFNQNEHSSLMTGREDNRTIFLTYLPRKGT